MMGTVCVALSQEGTTGASGASTDGNGWERWVQLGAQREPLGHLGQKIGMSASLGRMTAFRGTNNQSLARKTHNNTSSWLAFS